VNLAGLIKDNELLARSSVPKSRSAVAGAGNDAASVWAEHCALDRGLVSFQHGNLGAVFRVPDARRLVKGRRDDAVPTWIERRIRDPAVMAERQLLSMLQERPIERCFGLEQIGTIRRSGLPRQSFQRQQDCRLGIAGRRRLL
jgi:hypothetical protein